MRATIVLTGAVVLMASSLQATTVLVNDSFSYANQAAFEAVWAPIGSEGSGTLTTEQAASPTQSVKFGTAAGYRNRLTFAETQATEDEPIVFSFKFYDVAPTANPHRNYINIQDTTAPTGSGQLIAMGLNNNLLNSAGPGPRYMARVLGYEGGAFFKLDGPGVPARSLGWHELKVVITPTQFQFYVDGVAAQAIPNTNNRSFDNLALGSGLSSTQVAYFDDVYLAKLPEPATLLLLVVAAPFLRRRQA